MKRSYGKELKAMSKKNSKKHLLVCLFFIVPSICLSYQVLAKDMLQCEQSSRTNHDYFESLLKDKKQKEVLLSDIHFLYIMGTSTLCFGDTIEGLSYLTKAVTLKSALASSIVGAYYLSDKTFKNRVITNDFKNYEVAISYFKKSINYFIERSQNPRIYNDMSSYFAIPIEQRMLISARTFTTLPHLYFMQYGKTIFGVFNTDTLSILENIQKATEQCKLWESVAIAHPGSRAREYVYKALLRKCQYYSDFSKEVLPIEKLRLEVIKTCDYNLSCPAHKQMQNRIANLAADYRRKLSKVSLLPMY